MGDRLVWELAFQASIASVFIGRHQVAQGDVVCVLNDLTNHVLLASNGTNHANLGYQSDRHERE
jgi:hypothetical protein